MKSKGQVARPGWPGHPGQRGGLVEMPSAVSNQQTPGSAGHGGTHYLTPQGALGRAAPGTSQHLSSPMSLVSMLPTSTAQPHIGARDPL